MLEICAPAAPHSRSLVNTAPACSWGRRRVDHAGRLDEVGGVDAGLFWVLPVCRSHHYPPRQQGPRVTQAWPAWKRCPPCTQFSLRTLSSIVGAGPSQAGGSGWRCYCNAVSPSLLLFDAWGGGGETGIHSRQANLAGWWRLSRIDANRGGSLLAGHVPLICLAVLTISWFSMDLKMRLSSSIRPSTSPWVSRFLTPSSLLIKAGK